MPMKKSKYQDLFHTILNNPKGKVYTLPPASLLPVKTAMVRLKNEYNQNSIIGNSTLGTNELPVIQDNFRYEVLEETEEFVRVRICLQPPANFSFVIESAEQGA